MGRQGPCFHCGIEHTPLWRSGPPEKPVLCNACGSRWRIRGTLLDYTPKHAMKNTQSYQLGKLPLQVRPAIPIREKVAINYHFSGCFEDDTNNRSSSGSSMSLSEDCVQMETTNGSVQSNFWDNIPTRKRSLLPQCTLSPVGWLHRQLHSILQEPEFANLSADQEDDVLIFHNNDQTPCTETALGAMLLKPPPTSYTKEYAEPVFPILESHPSSLTDFQIGSSLVGKNPIPDNVALKNEHLYMDARAAGQGNKFYPPHMNIGSKEAPREGYKSLRMIYSNSSPAGGDKVPLPGKRGRGRPRIRTPGTYLNNDRADTKLPKDHSRVQNSSIRDFNMLPMNGSIDEPPANDQQNEQNVINSSTTDADTAGILNI